MLVYFMNLQLHPKLSIHDSIINGHDSHKLSMETLSPFTAATEPS